MDKNSESLIVEQPTIIDVPLVHQPHKITIAPHLLNSLRQLCPLLDSDQVLVITDKQIAAHYMAQLTQAINCQTLMLPQGEQHKTLATFHFIIDKLIKNHYDRKTLLVAFGGGVIGDLTGFSASCYCRGIDYIQIPTTLLAQVDAAIGGKTGVNHELAKNIIGAFHQPKAILIDPVTLTTLPEREYRSGLAEVVKYALLADNSLFVFLENNVHRIQARQIDLLYDIITRCAAIKARIITQDEYESDQIRILLNLGHTFAHAIEAATQYQQFLHGEAVAIGLWMAAELSYRQRKLLQVEKIRIQQLLMALRLVKKPPQILTTEMISQHIQYDKKARKQKLRFILLTQIGCAVVEDDIDWPQLRRCVSDCLIELTYL